MLRCSSAAAAIPTIAVSALVASSLFFVGVSRADEATIVAVPAESTVPVTAPSPVPDPFRARYETRRPNLVMTGGGLITLGVSYSLAAIAGAVSSHQGDGRLFVPIVGPWLDLGARGGCGMTGATTCAIERGSRIGL